MSTPASSSLVIADPKGLDLDIHSAMVGALSWPDFIVRRVKTAAPADRPALVRYIAERVHDVLVAWSS